MAEFKSKYLDQVFEISISEFFEDERAIRTISHDSIENIIHNCIPASLSVNYDYNVLKAELNHSVVLCTIYDNTGRRVQAIGESTEASIAGSEIATNYPTLMATLRAFDRAAMRYLDLDTPGKIYSDNEIFNTNKKTTTIVEDGVATKNDTIESKINTESVESVTTDTQAAYEENSFTPTHAPVSVKKEVENVSKENKSTSECATVIVNMGKYKGLNKTVAEVYEDDPNWCSFITTVKSKAPEVEAIKQYLSELGVSNAK